MILCFKAAVCVCEYNSTVIPQTGQKPTTLVANKLSSSCSHGFQLCQQLFHNTKIKPKKHYTMKAFLITVIAVVLGVLVANQVQKRLPV